MVTDTQTELDVPVEADEPQGGWSRQQVAESIVTRHAATAAAAGFIPVPLGDVAGITATALNMMKRISDVYDVGFSREAALNVIGTLVSGATPLALKATAIGMLKAVPGVGTWAGMASMPILGGATVFAIGQVMIRHYESGGDLLNFDAKGAKDYFRKQLAAEQASRSVS